MCHDLDNNDNNNNDNNNDDNDDNNDNNNDENNDSCQNNMNMTGLLICAMSSTRAGCQRALRRCSGTRR